ncbi:MAG: rod shape-determining protein RodA [Bacteroidales bacterium]|nr:rod shape-determining protein RodA [Bacteroidales bacterium]
MKRNDTIKSSTDWVLVVLYIIMVLMGWMNIYAAVYDESHPSIFDLGTSYGKQMLWIVTSAVIILAIMFTDAKFFPAFAWVIYGLTIILLIAVLVMGKEVAGSKSWIQVGAFGLQPAEFAKIGAALALARYLGDLHVKLQSLRTRILSGVIIAIPAVFIFLQNDTGSALVFLAFLLVMYREGLSGNILLLGILAVFLFIVSLLFDKFIVIGVMGSVAFLAWLMIRRVKRSLPMVLLIFLGSAAFVYSVDYAFNNILEDHQRTRINVLLGTETDLRGAGYNVNQSKIAIGSGGFFGKGFLQGTQTKYDFVPEQSTDFIFCTVGEEWGFLGTTIVIGLFMLLLYRLLMLAERQRSAFSRIYGYSVAAIIFFHFAVNIGMTIGLAPVIGIPLPFFSYGGSSLWAFTILLFIFIRLDANRLIML